MKNDGSPFDQDWRDCLKEHYINAVRTHDNITLKTLKPVMIDIGFREDELSTFEIIATMKEV